MQATYQGLERALRALADHVLGSAELLEEFESARRRHFLQGSEQGWEAEGAEARFLEWFSLERRLASGRRPFELFLDAGCPGLDLEGETHALIFGQSLTGIFQVRERLEPSGFTVLDPLLEEPHRLHWPVQMSARPAAGGCLIGRLYLLPGERPVAYLPSPALVLYQDGDLGRALMEDVARARKHGQGLRLGQLDLERLLHGRLPLEPEPLGPTLGLVDLEDRIQLLFERHGFAGLSARELSGQVAAGGSFEEVFGELLDEVAFDTELDLDELRRLFLQLWTVAQSGPDSGVPRPEEPRRKGTGSWHDPNQLCPCGSGRLYLECHLGRDLVARLREAESRDEKLTPIFEGLDPLLEEEDTQEAITPVEEGLFEVHALVDEYLWETGLAPDHPVALMLSGYLSHLRARPAGRPALRAEDLIGRPLVGWLLHRFLALPLQEGAIFLGSARALWPALASWLEKEHGICLEEPGAMEFLATHLDALDRALQARRELSSEEPRPGGSGLPAGIFQVVEGAEPGRLGLALWPGPGDAPEPLDPAGTAHLRVGDLLWGRPVAGVGGTGFLGTVRVGPLESLPFLDEGESSEE